MLSGIRAKSNSECVQYLAPIVLLIYADFSSCKAGFLVNSHTLKANPYARLQASYCPSGYIYVGRPYLLKTFQMSVTCNRPSKCQNEIIIMDCFDELVDQLVKEIEEQEAKKRPRYKEAKRRFRNAVSVIVEDAWKALRSIPVRRCSVHLGSNHYSHTNRYADPNLTYRTFKPAYDGLLKLGYIEQTQKGYYDPFKMQGKLTEYQSSDKLERLFNDLGVYPAIYFQPSKDDETVLLRTKSDQRKVLIDYVETAQTNRHRRKLLKINQCLLRHWLDIELPDTEYATIAQRINSRTDKNPIDFSRRTLVRIFSNPDFKHGGRFYRGWWQNIPSEYRKYLTIDTKRTEELDYSQLNPNILYAMAGKEMGSADAYDRILGDKHRKLAKQAFNAMIQSPSPLRSCPKAIDLSKVGMKWAEIREAVLKAHQPIEQYFFKGIGNKLQYEDSRIAERIMLHFAKHDIPVYPVHDSFIMHHGYREELKDVMEQAFKDRFKADIDISVEAVDWSYLKKEQTSDHLDINTIMASLSEVSEWQGRNEEWFKHRKS